MSDSTTIAPPATDRVLLPLTFDVEKMQAEVNALKTKAFIYYDVLPLRAPAHIVDPNLPEPPPPEDYADGSWTEWANTEHLKASPYLTSIVEFFQQHTTVNLTRLLRLAPGAIVKKHTDPTLALEQERSMIRLTIPILRPDEVEFYLNGETVPMKPGECWYMRLSDPHKVLNNAIGPRVNLTVDVIPNEWVRNMIAEAAAE